MIPKEWLGVRETFLGRRCPFPSTSPAGSTIFWCNTLLEKATFHLRWNLGSLHSPYKVGEEQVNGWNIRKAFTWGPGARLRMDSTQYEALRNQNPRLLAAAKSIQVGMASAVFLFLVPSRACQDDQLPLALWTYFQAFGPSVQTLDGAVSFEISFSKSKVDLDLALRTCAFINFLKKYLLWCLDLLQNKLELGGVNGQGVQRKEDEPGVSNYWNWVMIQRGSLY